MSGLIRKTKRQRERENERERHMTDSRTVKPSLCRPDHVVDSSLGWTYSWMTNATESERARKTARKREKVFWQKNYAKHTNVDPSKDLHSQLSQCVCVGKSRRDSNERPVSCISDPSSAHTCPLFHSVCIETRASHAGHLTRCHLTCWYGDGKQKLWWWQGRKLSSCNMVHTTKMTDI